MGETIKNIQTPEVPQASKSSNPVHREVHETGKVGATAEKQIEDTRTQILGKYGIAPENVIIEPLEQEVVRKIRAFIILKNHNTNTGYYAEGHNMHVRLLEQIMEKYGQQYGIHDPQDITDKDFHIIRPWETLKGFIDPYQNGFQSFPQSRQALVNQLKSNKALNGVKDNDMEKIENGDMSIPQWFLTGRESS